MQAAVPSGVPSVVPSLYLSVVSSIQASSTAWQAHSAAQAECEAAVEALEKARAKVGDEERRVAEREEAVLELKQTAAAQERALVKERLAWRADMSRAVRAAAWALGGSGQSPTGRWNTSS